ncbi:MAG TPA: YcnI family protein [Patescibacteria group bacterium]|nr:YcnI family protein [Patescibacteria group bacterium]
MMKKSIVSLLTIIAAVFLGVAPAFAHVIVHPSSVGVAAFQEFTMSVPSEEDNPTVAIKLLIPDGLKEVTPNVKAGWTIDIKKNGTGDSAKVTEIDWTGGSIPSGQRDDFLFQAQVPSTPTTLKWKAYQTYSDGTVVSWDHDPKLSKGPDDDSAPPPYSTTEIINDLVSPTPEVMTPAKTSNADLLSIVAVGLSAVALVFALRRK